MISAFGKAIDTYAEERQTGLWSRGIELSMKNNKISLKMSGTPCLARAYVSKIVCVPELGVRTGRRASARFAFCVGGRNNGRYDASDPGALRVRRSEAVAAAAACALRPLPRRPLRAEFSRSRGRERRGVGSLHALLRGFLGKAQPSLTVVAGPRIGAAKEGRKALGLRNGLRQEQKDEGGRIVVATVCYVRSRCARHEEIPCAAVAERDRRQPAIGADRHDNVSGQEFTGKGPRKRSSGLWLMALSNV